MTRRDSEGDLASGTLARADGATIAYLQRSATEIRQTPGLVFLGGFRSDMTGTKATALDGFAANRGQACLRFDYRGHGGSSGQFEDLTIGDWRDDALLVLDRLTLGPQVLVGSSMGAWIMALVAVARPERIKALVGIAAAPDFTEDLMWAVWPQHIQAALMRDGVVHIPSAYAEEPTPIGQRLIEDGRRRLVLRGPIPFAGPVRLLHGMADGDVPWQTSLRLAQQLTSDDVHLTLIKGGDHRLSSPAEIGLLLATVAEICSG